MAKQLFTAYDLSDTKTKKMTMVDWRTKKTFEIVDKTEEVLRKELEGIEATIEAHKINLEKFEFFKEIFEEKLKSLTEKQ